MSKKISVIIPSRRERWLQQTIDDILNKASQSIEILAVLDGYWPDPPLREDKRVRQLHFTDNRGMRAAINAAARIATGDYLLKSDGHCLYGEGFDEILKADIDDDTVVVPRRYPLDVEKWEIIPDRQPVDYHFLSYPFWRPEDPTCGLHGQVWKERARARADILFDEEMSSQGSCYFLSKKCWEERVGPLDDSSYGVFAQEFQEVGLRMWLGGGRVMVNKKTFYAHLHKGKQYGTGYGFSNARWKQWAADNKKGHDHTIRFWMLDLWPQRVHDFRWLIERFGPVPTWPADLDEAFRRARETFG